MKLKKKLITEHKSVVSQSFAGLKCGTDVQRLQCVLRIKLQCTVRQLYSIRTSYLILNVLFSFISQGVQEGWSEKTYR